MKPLPLAASAMHRTALGLFLFYSGLAWGAIALSRNFDSISTLWYANACAIIFLQRVAGRQRWQLLLVAALASALAHLMSNHSLSKTLMFLPGNLLEMALGAWLLQTYCDTREVLVSPLALLKALLLAGVLPILAGSVVGAAMLASIGTAPFLQVAKRWFEGSLVGSLSILPLGLFLLEGGFKRIVRHLRDRFFLLAIGTMLVGVWFSLTRLPFSWVYVSGLLVVLVMVTRWAGISLGIFLCSIVVAVIAATGGLPMQADAGVELRLFLPLFVALLIPLFLACLLEKLEEQKLEIAARQQQVQDLYEQTPAMLHALDSDGVLQFVSNRWLERMGYARNEVVGQSVLAFILAQDIAKAQQEHVEKLRQEGALRRFPLRMVSRTGERIEVEVSSVLVRDAAFGGRRVLSVLEEVGERNRALAYVERQTRLLEAEQLSLRDSQERVQLATESSGVGIWEVDLLAMEMQWDAQQYRLHGLDISTKPMDLAGWSACIYPDDFAHVRARFYDAVRSCSNLEAQFRVVWPNGTVRYLKVLGRPRLNDAGKVISMVGTNRDVTEEVAYAHSLKSARDLARDAALAKGLFLANMSHELRTPMNAIIGLLQLLGHTALSDHQFDYLDKIDGAARSLLALLNDILDFSKIEAGKLDLEIRPFRMDQLFRELGVVLTSYVGRKKIAVRYELDPAIPTTLSGDALRLKQVLINLGGNAIKFTHAGEVVIALRLVPGEAADGPDPRQVRIAFSVRDTGIGIAPEHLPKLFDSFTQAEASTTRTFGGTGLGLSICKLLVEMMGATIAVESELGVGSCFSFSLRLPVSDDDTSEQAVVHNGSGLRSAKRMNRRALAGLRILLVEDNAINQQVAQELLQLQGAEVAIAGDGQQGVLTLSQPGAAFDLVLMDIQMPVMDGFEATRVIRAQLGLADLPIVGLTANAMASDRDDCLRCGMNAHVGKPFDIGQLVALITRLTGTETAQAPTAAPAAQILPTPTPTPTPQPQPEPEPEPEPEPVVQELDLDGALLRMGGAAELFVRAAHSLLPQLPEFADRLAVFMRSGDRQQCLRALHTVRGNAATLGLLRLAQSLRQLESQCREADELGACVGHLDALAQRAAAAALALRAAVVTLDSATAVRENPPPESTLPTRLAEAIERLVPLLASSDLAALALLTAERDVFAALAPAVLAQLTAAVQALDFDTGLQILNALGYQGVPQ